jgi:hypothetical protein
VGREGKSKDLSAKGENLKPNENQTSQNRETRETKPHEWLLLKSVVKRKSWGCNRDGKNKARAEKSEKE